MKTVLIIDDDDGVRSLVKYKLSTDFIVVEAIDGKKGLQSFKDIKPDLVITDIIMPEEEGFKTILDIRQIDKNVPIIAITGMLKMGDMNPLDVAKEFGANHGQYKPLNLNELKSKINDLLA